jgi:hypothetical protein
VCGTDGDCRRGLGKILPGIFVLTKRPKPTTYGSNVVHGYKLWLHYANANTFQAKEGKIWQLRRQRKRRDKEPVLVFLLSPGPPSPAGLVVFTVPPSATKLV